MTSDDSPAILDERSKVALLALARWSIFSRFDGKAEAPAIPRSAALQAGGGMFVTLRKQGELRGCIGHIESDKPLTETVIEVARSAAFSDSRFSPLQESELSAIDLEISILTPPVPVASYDHIEIGRHGVILSKGIHRALFLPQVAVEQGWDRETMLDFLARKGGLARGEWRSGCSFKVFEAIHFAEK